MSWLLPYIGGKSELAPIIVHHMPAHRCYVEVFGGSAAVLLEDTRSPASVEVYNDLSSDLYRFFMVLREAGGLKPVLDRLVTLCEWTPMSRKLYQEWWKDWRQGKLSQDDPVEWAARWFFLQACSIDGHGGWTHAASKNKAEEWQSHIRRLEKAARRLARVQIECKDFSYVIEHYDSPDTLFYCDPPYMEVERVSSYYRGLEMSPVYHRKMARLLNNIQGKAIVSYYPLDCLKEWYPAPKWSELRVDVHKWASGVSAGGTKPPAEELLLFNYEMLPLDMLMRAQEKKL